MSRRHSTRVAVNLPLLLGVQGLACMHWSSLRRTHVHACACLHTGSWQRREQDRPPSISLHAHLPVPYSPIHHTPRHTHTPYTPQTLTTTLLLLGTFKLTLEFSEDYPNKAPVVKFKSTMFHPNSEWLWLLLLVVMGSGVVAGGGLRHARRQQQQ